MPCAMTTAVAARPGGSALDLGRRRAAADRRRAGGAHRGRSGSADGGGSGGADRWRAGGADGGGSGSAKGGWSGRPDGDPAVRNHHRLGRRLRHAELVYVGYGQPHRMRDLFDGEALLLEPNRLLTAEVVGEGGRGGGGEDGEHKAAAQQTMQTSHGEAFSPLRWVD